MNQIDRVRHVILSCVSIRDSIEDQALLANFLNINSSTISFASDEHRKIFRYIHKYFMKHESLPATHLLFENYTEDPDTLAELYKIFKITDHNKPYNVPVFFFGTDLKEVIDDIIEEQCEKDVLKAQKETNQIIEQGMKVSYNKNLKGIHDGVDYLFENVRKAIRPLEEPVSYSKKSLFSDIQDRKSELSEDGIPILQTGFEPFDDKYDGLYLSEFLLFIAHTGELKSTLTMNAIYNMWLVQDANIEYISLEMTVRDCWAYFISLHSANNRYWVDGQTPLPKKQLKRYFSEKARNGDSCALNDEQLLRLEEVIKDIESREAHLEFRANHGRWTVQEIENHCLNVELTEKIRIDVIVIDHGELIVGTERDRLASTDKNLKELRELTLRYQKNRGVRIIVPYQTNKNGKADAKRENYKYTTSSLSWSTEAPRSATMIIASYYDGIPKENGYAAISVVKTRDDGSGDQFSLNVDKLDYYKLYHDPKMRTDFVNVPSRTGGITKKETRDLDALLDAPDNSYGAEQIANDSYNLDK